MGETKPYIERLTDLELEAVRSDLRMKIQVASINLEWYRERLRSVDEELDRRKAQKEE